MNFKNNLMPRMGAGTYLICMSTMTLLWSSMLLWLCHHRVMNGDWSVQKLAGFMSACGLVYGILFFWLTAKRLKDLNFPGWSVKLLSIPLFAVIVLPVLCFLSGPRYANDYGDAPEASGFLKVCAALVLFATATLVTYKALLIAEQL